MSELSKCCRHPVVLCESSVWSFTPSSAENEGDLEAMDLTSESEFFAASDVVVMLSFCGQCRKQAGRPVLSDTTESKA